MATKKRKFSEEQKRDILKEAEQIGISHALRNHMLSYSVFSRWRDIYVKGIVNRNDAAHKARAKTELKQFIEENARLKKIIADQALELERKDEELRKSYALHLKR